MDLTHALLNILLVLLGIIGVGMLVLLALAITTLLEVLALAKSVRVQVGAIGGALRAVGEGIGDRINGLSGLMSLFGSKEAKAKPKTRKKA